MIFARWPEPGKVKMRLAADLGNEEAARIYRRLLDHTVAVACSSGLAVELRVTGASPVEFAEVFGPGITVREQGEGDLGERLARVEGPAIIIGSDLPGLTADLLGQAASRLQTHEAVIGPAKDGGYWLIGFRENLPWLFSDMAWSTPAVLPETLTRLKTHRIAPAMLPEMSDVDEAADLTDWPEFAP